MTDLKDAAELRVGVRDLRTNLSHYLRDVVIAELAAPTRDAPLPPRQFGLLKGKIRIAEDFDTWPDDILNSFER